MSDGLLKGYRALDLTDQKGLVCGLILADMGVEVIKIEKPGGDPARNIPPFFQDTCDSEKSLYWFAFNTNKRSITLNLETKKGQDIFKRLLKTTDFVLESYTPGYLESLKLGYEDLKKINQKIILTSITHFGQKGPFSKYKGSELVDAAMSGVLDNTGQPGLPPVKEGLDSLYFHAGATAAMGTLMSLFALESTREGQQVDVSIQQVGVSRTTLTLLPWMWDKRMVKRTNMGQTGVYPFPWVWTCKDGFVFWFFLGGQIGAPANKALSQWMAEVGITDSLSGTKDWNELDKSALTKEVLDSFQEAITAFFKRYTKKEIEAEGSRRGLNAVIASDPEDVMENKQYSARHYWQEIDHPELGTRIPYPRHFFLSNTTENFACAKAPGLGQDNEAIYNQELGLSHEKIDVLKNEHII
jgi:crotonobetainyl-CoA:carnitine CoA-transferase CaiB-like acyl-CoA transferase